MQDNVRVERHNNAPASATPQGMAALLERIHRKELLQPATAELLLDILRRCRTGSARIQGLLPANTEVAHKTGSMPMVANDVGILTLPNGAGHVAFAAFTKSATDTVKSERAIAEIARAVHDYFLFVPKGPIDYQALSDSIVKALAPRAGEKFYLRADPEYFRRLRSVAGRPGPPGVSGSHRFGSAQALAQHRAERDNRMDR